MGGTLFPPKKSRKYSRRMDYSMTTQLDILFADIKKKLKCDAVGGDVLTLPPSSTPDNISLVVNCYFKPEWFVVSGNELLMHCQTNVRKALETITEFIQKQDFDFDVVGVSIFRIVDAGQKTRVYWANSRKDLLINLNCAITSEGSHIEELSTFLSG